MSHLINLVQKLVVAKYWDQYFKETSLANLVIDRHLKTSYQMQFEPTRISLLLYLGNTDILIPNSKYFAVHSPIVGVASFKRAKNTNN